ncbi:MAG: hypothetical protein OZ921_03710 [Sorangiineae bacterium]|nr:hypothetical protein [Polyangiaceae bacterium]MEB2321596.1 hypothetical protein [Sorangiineae bacterium]
MRRLRIALAAGVLALAAGALFGARAAEARVEGDSPYSRAQTFNAALRYVRVDLGYEVVEKDADAGYLLFKYAQPGRKTATEGAFEIVQVKDTVKVYVQLPKMPEYHEVVLRDGLLRKLRDEYGAPPAKRPATPKPAPAPPSDAGTD